MELAGRKLVRIIFIIIILCFETATGNKSYLSVEQNINQRMFVKPPTCYVAKGRQIENHPKIYIPIHQVD